MNSLHIIGNLTSDPELRTTRNGENVCKFTVAVNRRTKAEKPEADFFRVTAWGERGVTCSKYLAKGKKVSVVGPVTVDTYQTKTGETRASLEVKADDVEFLTPRSESIDKETGYEKVNPEGLPFIQDELPV